VIFLGIWVYFHMINNVDRGVGTIDYD
jgi:hypothetical protein